MDIIIGQKGKCHWSHDLSPVVYFPKEDTALITRYFSMMKTSDEIIENNITIALCHESMEPLIVEIELAEAASVNAIPSTTLTVKFLGLSSFSSFSSPIAIPSVCFHNETSNRLKDF
jgi:hypothetical protein